MDGLMSIPPVLLAIALMALTRASMENVILAITLPRLPRVVRLVRRPRAHAARRALRLAAVAAGTRLPRILWRHILPNIVAPLLVQATYVCASAMITEAILSFIGAGTPPEHPELGQHHGRGAQHVPDRRLPDPVPGICLSLTVLAVNLLGDGLRDALDPRLARRM
jgi:peptide/nickel transport system permease protein